MQGVSNIQNVYRIKEDNDLITGIESAKGKGGNKFETKIQGKRA